MSKEIKFVSADDWCVIYGPDDKKIWEGHSVNDNCISAMAEYFGCDIGFYEFTNENEIDGCTPDNFGQIVGIKRYLV